jgi:hypothetical protein
VVPDEDGRQRPPHPPPDRRESPGANRRMSLRRPLVEDQRRDAMTGELSREKTGCPAAFRTGTLEEHDTGERVSGAGQEHRSCQSERAVAEGDVVLLERAGERARCGNRRIVRRWSPPREFPTRNRARVFR